MRIARLALCGLLMWAAAVSAQDKPSSGETADPIAAVLKKSQEEYTAAVEQAAEGMSAAFAAQIKKLEDNAKLPVQQQLKMLADLQAEQTAFDADPAALPQSATMKAATSEYRKSVDAARGRCAKAFDRAAEAYRAKKDLAAAKAVLAEKAQYLQAVAAAAPLDQKKLAASLKPFYGAFADRAAGRRGNGGDHGRRYTALADRLKELIDQLESSKASFKSVSAFRLELESSAIRSAPTKSGQKEEVEAAIGVINKALGK